MALVTSPLGTIKQSIDNLNFRTWKDKNVIARRVTTSNQPNTPSQVAQKEKFGAAVAMCRALLPALRIGFKSLAKSMTEANVFMSLNLKALGWDAIGGKLTGLDKMIISKGSLAGLKAAKITLSDYSDLKIVWDDNSDGVSGMATDRLIVSVFGVDSGQSVVFNTGVLRSAGLFTAAAFATDYSSDTFHVCAFFVSADGRSVSDNVNGAVIVL